ncbi:CpsD/CapB family tyrosine-protein kinase [Agarilytica rhodophyticola]|uniref:CpsD/CapB family tyrosine-protein kinase n=1 Tax=Agarilytica rhodophyticola TaxID=1737490 RepID=UPI000B3480F3|nr:CpsD/CapB family tyrosine-protein kinase [Agarilytica rhodophyticola]
MYRIQKAVLKAKEAEDNKPTTHKPKKAVGSPLEDLKYSRTRVMTSHPDHMEDSRIIAGFNNNANSQTFRTLRTQVIQKMRENNWRSLAVTSPSAGEGKSIITANLAVAIAMEVNQTVLLVDLDLKKPSLGEMFGVDQEYGLLDYLKGRTELENIMVNPGVERLVLVPGKGSIERSSEVISTPKMVSFFNETKARYKSRIVIYDMPPVLPTDDVLSSVKNVDCALLVLEDGKNPEKDIVRAVRQLQKTSLIGTVLNKYHSGGWLL